MTKVSSTKRNQHLGLRGKLLKARDSKCSIQILARGEGGSHGRALSLFIAYPLKVKKVGEAHGFFR
jgi:hypothetical protein